MMREPTQLWRAALVAAMLCVPLVCKSADAQPAAAPPSSVVARLVSPDGTVLKRGKPDQAWQIVEQNGELHADEMLIGLPGAAIETDKRAVRLTLLTDMDKTSPYPILEAAVSLHPSPDVDLDFTLDRGRVDITNIKEKGAARVRIRFHDQKWEATLTEPGTRVAMQLYGRWAKGAKFTPEPSPKDVPAADLLFLVRKGHVQLSHGSCFHSMSAPPGPARLHWDNSGEADEAPRKLDKLPKWAEADHSTSERAERIKKVVEEFRRECVKSSPFTATRLFVRSQDPNQRATGVIFMGAMDDLDGVGGVLTGTKYLDTWDRAVVVVRHWIGRCACQDQIVYKLLEDKRGITPARAEGILQLLHSFGDDELAHPELYKMLVRFLDNDELGIRGLSYWHLVRLVPAGGKFGYNPLAPKEQRDKARDQWKKLINDMIARKELPPKDPAAPKDSSK
ncbi:MAG TPA: hypothetical protein VH643_26100 [Gemmataceae bacterium]|jgi:hypothetical protein